MNRERQLEEFRRTIVPKYIQEVNNELLKPLKTIIEPVIKNKYDCETKVCKKCGEELPLSEFYYHPMKKQKRFNICKTCIKKYQKNYRLKQKLNS